MCTEVGDQHVPAARGEREPVGRPAAPRRRPGADDPEHPAVEQLVDPALTVVRAMPAAGTRSALLAAAPDAISRASVLSVTSAVEPGRREGALSRSGGSSDGSALLDFVDK